MTDQELNAIVAAAGTAPDGLWAAWRPALAMATSIEIASIGKGVGLRAHGTFDAPALVKAEAARLGADLQEAGGAVSVSVSGKMCLAAPKSDVLTLGPCRVNVGTSISASLGRLEHADKAAGVFGAIGLNKPGSPFEAATGSLWLEPNSRARVVIRPPAGGAHWLKAQLDGLKDYLDRKTKKPPELFGPDPTAGMLKFGKIVSVTADGDLITVVGTIIRPPDELRLNVLTFMVPMVVRGLAQ